MCIGVDTSKWYFQSVRILGVYLAHKHSNKIILAHLVIKFMPFQFALILLGHEGEKNLFGASMFLTHFHSWWYSIFRKKEQASGSEPMTGNCINYTLITIFPRFSPIFMITLHLWQVIPIFPFLNFQKGSHKCCSWGRWYQRDWRLSGTDVFCLCRGRCMCVKQLQGQRQTTLLGYWLVVSSLNYWFLTQATPEYLLFLLPVCPETGRQHVNASYNRWWMASACQSLTLWVFSNFIIYPFLYCLQPSIYDKMVSNDRKWARIPRNCSAFSRGEILCKKAFSPV